MIWHSAAKAWNARPDADAESHCPDQPIQVVVPYTEAKHTREALTAAAVMTRGLSAIIKLVAVQVIPFPAPFYCPATMREHLEAELELLAGECISRVEATIVLARTQEEGYRHAIEPETTVLLTYPRRVWPTRQERLARQLRRLGYKVALVQSVEDKSHA